MRKEFKAFEKVIVILRDSDWEVDFYSHYDEVLAKHRCVGNGWVSDNNILPYEGNEELVGKTESPDEEVRLEKGEWVMVCDAINIHPESWKLRRYDSVGFLINAFCNISASLTGWKFAIRFSDFNPNDMEETRKHILCVKNGKIIRYKG